MSVNTYRECTNLHVRAAATRPLPPGPPVGATLASPLCPGQLAPGPCWPGRRRGGFGADQNGVLRTGRGCLVGGGLNAGRAGGAAGRQDVASTTQPGQIVSNSGCVQPERGAGGRPGQPGKAGGTHLAATLGEVRTGMPRRPRHRCHVLGLVGHPGRVTRRATGCDDAPQQDNTASKAAGVGAAPGPQAGPAHRTLRAQFTEDTSSIPLVAAARSEAGITGCAARTLSEVHNGFPSRCAGRTGKSRPSNRAPAVPALRRLATRAAAWPCNVAHAARSHPDQLCSAHRASMSSSSRSWSAVSPVTAAAKAL